MSGSGLTFNISLSVLNHLGRNLYRSFTTVLGEAISNSWDADAENVWLYYDKDAGTFCIKDDGTGMTQDDFQNKFLKIGYSKRRNGVFKSPVKNRHFIGRKGIGKLALLSFAERIDVASKVEGGDYVGGAIENSRLDVAILDDVSAHEYELEEINKDALAPFLEGHQKGTIILFTDLKDQARRTDDFLMKIIALYFRFSLIDPDFTVYLNDQEITLESLRELATNTQFLWVLGDFEDPYIDDMCAPAERVSLDAPEGVRGFIASTKKPSQRNIFSTGERVGVDLFVNGRMRETNILRHIPSSRVPESYLYGQLHFDSFDSDENDPFTSSREGVQADDARYREFLQQVRSIVLRIIDQWDSLREKYNEDSDPDNTSRESSRTKKAKSLYREVAKEYVAEEGSGDGGINDFTKSLADDAAFNISSYVQCFISENLLRRYITENGSAPTECSSRTPQGDSCLDRLSNGTGGRELCEFCKGDQGMRGLQQQKDDARIAFQIRNEEENLLLYLDYVDLAKIVDDRILRDEDKYYKPLRNSVMHTSLLTPEAKTKLRSVFDNVVATVRRLVSGAGNE